VIKNRGSMRCPYLDEMASPANFKVFESAARLGSLAAAVLELHVSVGAVASLKAVTV
jgi:hypothetical protein